MNALTQLRVNELTRPLTLPSTREQADRVVHSDAVAVAIRIGKRGVGSYDGRRYASGMTVQTSLFLTLMAVMISALNCSEGEVPRDSKAGPNGAPASLYVYVAGVTLTSGNEGGVKIRVRADELVWRKRQLRFFSVAFLWELQLRNGTIDIDLNSLACEAQDSGTGCGLAYALQETKELVGYFGVSASRVSIRPLTLTLMDHGASRFSLQSAGGQFRADHEVSFEGVVHATSSTGQSLTATRVTLKRGGSLVVKGQWTLSSGSNSSLVKGARGVFRLDPDGSIELVKATGISDDA